MAVYCKPSFNEYLSVFNPSNWICGVNNDGTTTSGGISLAYANANFLKFPSAQGNETLVDIDVLGTSQFNGSLNEFTNRADFNGTTNFNSNIKLNAGYLRFPNASQQTTAMNTLTPSLNCPIASITTDATGAISSLSSNTALSVNSITYSNSSIQTTAMNTLTASLNCSIASITTDANGAISSLSNNTALSVSSITYPDSTVQTTAGTTSTIPTTVINAVNAGTSLTLTPSGSSSFQNFKFNYSGGSFICGAFTCVGMSVNAQWTLSIYNGAAGTVFISTVGSITNWSGTINLLPTQNIYLKISIKSFNNVNTQYIEATYPLY